MSWWTTILWRECGSKQLFLEPLAETWIHSTQAASHLRILESMQYETWCVGEERSVWLRLVAGKLRLFQFSNLMKRWWMKPVGWDTFMSSQLTSNHSVICSYSKIMIVASILVSKVNIFIQMKWFWSRLSQLRFCFISKR